MRGRFVEQLPLPPDRVSYFGRLATRGSAFFVDGTRVPLTHDEPHLGGLRTWFLCPRCNRRCRHIYFPEILCRRCCGLDWASREIWVVLTFRRSSLILRQHSTQSCAAEEHALVELLGQVNSDLDRVKTRRSTRGALRAGREDLGEAGGQPPSALDMPNHMTGRNQDWPKSEPIFYRDSGVYPCRMS
jgi:hypothetical protein